MKRLFILAIFTIISFGPLHAQFMDSWVEGERQATSQSGAIYNVEVISSKQLTIAVFTTNDLTDLFDGAKLPNDYYTIIITNEQGIRKIVQVKIEN